MCSLPFLVRAAGSTQILSPIDLGPAHASYLIAPLQGERQHLKEGAEGFFQFLGGAQDKPKLLIGEYAIAGGFLAWRLDLRARRRFHEVALDCPVEHVPEGSKDAVGVDGMLACDVIQKSNDISALNSVDPPALPFLDDIAAVFCLA